MLQTADQPASRAEAPPPTDAAKPADGDKKPRKKKHRFWRGVLMCLLVIAVILGIARLMMPRAVRWYVNRTIDEDPLYQGKIGDIDINLWRGAYAIHDIRLNKRTGNVPVPFFAAKVLDFQVQWDALLHRKIVGRVRMVDPELNFVDSGDESQSQTGGGGPWMKMLQDLFPFDLNSCQIHNGAVHFRAYHRSPQVDVYLDHAYATIENLKNVKDELTPMMATVHANAIAMGQAKFEFQMKLDPFSYRPTFQVATRLLGLDVRKLNELSRAYGGIDFEDGNFDLVVEMDAKEGQLDGYVKPLFRHLKVLTLPQDLKEDNPIEFFWEAVVGVVHGLLKNQPRDQFATLIPLRGDLTGPRTNVLTVVGNVLRNAFIRAYLPRLQGVTDYIDNLQFGRGSITEPSAVGTQ